MEHLENITRRQLLGLGAVAAGSLLIPSIAYAASPENNEREGDGFIHRATITNKEGGGSCQHRNKFTNPLHRKRHQTHREPHRNDQ